MKNFSKKVILFIITIIVCLIPANKLAVSYDLGTVFDVYSNENCTSQDPEARTKTDSDFYYYYNYTSSDVAKVTNSKWTEYLKAKDGTKLGSLLCIDPVLVTPSEVKIVRYLNPYSGNYIGYDAAQIYILKANGSDLVKETASRLINAAWNNQNTESLTVYTNFVCQGWGYLNAYSQTAYNWLNGNNNNLENWKIASGIKSLSSLKFKEGTCASNTRISKNPFLSYNTTGEKTDLDDVWNLFVGALKAGANAVSNKKSIDANKILTVSSQSETTLETLNNQYYLKKNVTLEVRKTGLENGFIRIKSIDITNNSNASVTVSPGIGTNLINSTNVNLSFLVPENKNFNNPLKYSITFEYCPDSDCKVGYVFKSTSASESSQRLIGLDKSGKTNAISNILTFTTEIKRPCDTTINISSACDKGTTGTIITKKDAQNNDDAKCFTDNSDDVGNTYKLDNSKYLFGNSSCENIYCKEEYKINFDPYGVVKEQNKEFAKVTSGRYFQINATITDYITCYIVTTTPACKTVATRLVRNIMSKNYPKFSFLTKTGSFSELQYKYDDDYFGQLSKQKDYVNMKKNIPTIDYINIWYCPSMSQSSDYRNCAVTPQKIASNHIDATLYSKLALNKIGLQDGRLKIALTTSAGYSTKTQYQNIYTSGSIKKSTTSVKNPSDVNGLPVKIDTEKGLYQYKFRLTNLGDYYDNQGNPGRLIGNKHSVLSKLQSQGKVKFNGEYVCYYFVNCPNCKADCSGDKCEWNNCPTCNSDCVNCLYDESKLKLNFRQVSSNDINPNDRELGYNWNIGSPTYFVNTEFNYTNLKAWTTVTEIEKNGEQAEQTPILTVDMTPELAQELRKYNKNKSYSNDTMECYDIDKDSKTYKNLACYSTVLDDLKSKYNNQINFINTRTATGKRNTQTVSDSGYWTLFTSSNQIRVGTNDKGKYYTTTTFNFDDPNHIGGPSWK